MLLKRLKIFITLSIIALICLLYIYNFKSNASNDSSTTVTLTAANELYLDVMKCYKYDTNPDYKGPMKITKGTFTHNNQTNEVYLVLLCGYDIVKNQPTNAKNYLQSLFNLSSEYKSLVYDKIINNVPINSNIIFTGHSLGGMVSQQLACDTYIKNNYNIFYTITYGAPLLNPKEREGALRRFTDRNDPMTYISFNNFLNFKVYRDTQIKDCTHLKNPFDAHTQSYLNEEVWGVYDILGNKTGNASFSYETNAQKTYTCFTP